MAQSHQRVVTFPAHRVRRAAAGNATTSEIIASRARLWVGRLMNACRVPGAIRPTQFHDEVTDRDVSISIDDGFVRLSVDGRDYFFDRITGRFDGTGTSAD